MSADFPVPVFWRTGVTRSFAEIPVSGAPFVSVEVQRVEYRGVAGIMVALHQPSGPVEIHAEPQLGLDRNWFTGDPAFGQFELAAVTDTTFEVARCDVVPGTVDMAARFVDSRGHQIDVAAAYRSRRASSALVTPAPLQQNPITLRFLLMNEFRLLPRRGSDIRVTVDDRPAEIKNVLPTSLAPITQARMSTDLLLVGLLPAHVDRPLDDHHDVEHRDQQTTTEFVDDRLVSVATANDSGAFTVRFVDPLPNPATTDLDRPRSGHFTVDSTLGIVATGQWDLTRTADGVSFGLRDLSQDWAPPVSQPTRLALRRVRRLRRRRLDWTYGALLREQAGRWTSSGSWSIAARSGRVR